MDAQRLPARHLGLSDEEYAALIWVRDALDPEVPDTNLPNWMRFDMDSWDCGEIVPGAPVKHSCGTGRCIGGSMSMRMIEADRLPSGTELTHDDVNRQNHMDSYLSDDDHPLANLFFRYRNSQDLSRPACVAAIDRFLAGNQADPWLLGLPLPRA